MGPVPGDPCERTREGGFRSGSGDPRLGETQPEVAESKASCVSASVFVSCLLVLPACWSCLLVLPAGPACWSCLLVLPAGPACWSCLLVLPAGPACWSCLLVLPAVFLLTRACTRSKSRASRHASDAWRGCLSSGCVKCPDVVG